MIKRAKREAVKLSFTEALPVIKNAAYNLRYRTKIIEIMQSKDVESCDSDDDCCDEQCVPPHHLPTCKVFQQHLILYMRVHKITVYLLIS